MVVVNQHLRGLVRIQRHHPVVIVLVLDRTDLLFLVLAELCDLLGFRPAVLRIVSLLATFVALNFLAFAFGIGLAFSFSFLSLGLLAGLVEPTVHQLVTGFSTTVASSLELRLAVLAFAERLAVALALRLAAALAFPERVYLHRRRIVGTGHAGVQLPPDDQVDKRVLHLVVCVEAAGVRVDCRLQLLRDASHDHCHLNLIVQA